MGFLDTLLGNADQTQALGLLGAGWMSRNPSQGFLLASEHLAGASKRKMQEQFQQMQMQELQSQIEARRLKAAQEQAEMERRQRIQQGIPGLFKQPGFTGGEPMPQTEGGIPMFSRPMGAAPMQSTPGGFDVQGALRLGVPLDDIPKLASLQNVGRQKVARTLKGIGPDGREFEYQVDEFGNRIGEGLPQYRAPITVNQGNRTTFADPYSLQPKGSFQTFQSPDSAASVAATLRGQNMTDARARERFALDQSNAQAGKAPTGYRFKADGTLEAIPGGPADIKAGELGAKAAARSQSAVAQADSVLKEIQDAKGLVGWNTAGVGGVGQFIPATEARDLAAKLQTIKANLGFDRLQQMRDQSPTGGALGQVAVQELASLQATVASLDQLQSPKQLGTALDKIEQHYTKWRNVVQQASSPQGGASGGWSIREKR